MRKVLTSFAYSHTAAGGGRKSFNKAVVAADNLNRSEILFSCLNDKTSITFLLLSYLTIL